MIDRTRLKAIAFDLDGVLWDSTPLHAAAFAEILAREGITDFVYESYAGQRTPDVMRSVLQGGGRACEPERIERLAREKTDLARRMMQDHKPIAPGCEDLLRSLATRYTLGLASSGSAGSVAMFLEMSGTRPHFKSVLSGDDVKHAKPDAEIYLTTALQIGVEPNAMLVVEDAVSGVQAGRAAGAIVLGLSRHNGGALVQAGAVAVLSDLAQLRDLLLDP